MVQWLGEMPAQPSNWGALGQAISGGVGGYLGARSAGLEQAMKGTELGLKGREVNIAQQQEDRQALEGLIDKMRYVPVEKQKDAWQIVKQMFVQSGRTSLADQIDRLSEIPITPETKEWKPTTKEEWTEAQRIKAQAMWDVGFGGAGGAGEGGGITPRSKEAWDILGPMKHPEEYQRKGWFRYERKKPSYIVTPME